MICCQWGTHAVSCNTLKYMLEPFPTASEVILRQANCCGAGWTFWWALLETQLRRQSNHWMVTLAQKRHTLQLPRSLIKAVVGCHFSRQTHPNSMSSPVCRQKWCWAASTGCLGDAGNISTRSLDMCNFQCCHRMCVRVCVNHSWDYALSAHHVRVQLGGHLGCSLTNPKDMSLTFSQCPYSKLAS